MPINTLEVNKIVTPGGVVVVDATDPVNPLTVLDTKLSDIGVESAMVSKAEFEANRNQNIDKYAGSGVSSTKTGMDKFISNTSTGIGVLFHTKSYPDTRSLKNQLAFPLDSATFPDRAYGMVVNVKGVRHYIPRVGGVQNRGTGGVIFPDAVLPKVENTPTNTSVDYKYGDMALVDDVNVELYPEGNFVVPTTRLTTWAGIGTLVHDAVNSNYVITAVNDRAILQVKDYWSPAGATTRILIDVTASNGATLVLTGWIYARDGSPMLNKSFRHLTGNTYEFIIENYTDTTTLLGINLGVVPTGVSVVIDNLSIKRLEPTKVVCIADTIAGSAMDIFSFRGIDTFGRKDFSFIESWSEDVSVNDFVYPLGAVQHKGIGLVSGTFPGSDTYSGYGQWTPPGTLVGGGYVWSTMSKADKLAFVSNPDNNMFVDNGVVKQYRYRIRVIQGTTPYTRLDRLNAKTSGSAVMTHNYIRTQGKDVSVVDVGDTHQGRILYVGNNYGNDAGSYGKDTTTLAIPLMMVQRRNMGIYHSVYNPNGCAMVIEAGSLKTWYETTIILSEADCFDPAKIGTVDPLTSMVSDLATTLAGTNDPLVYLQTGTVDSALSGRPDGKYSDEIHVEDVEDKRMDANKVTSKSDYLKDEMSKVLNGTKRVSEGGIRFEKTSISFNITAPASAETHPTYGNYGYRTRVGSDSVTYDIYSVTGHNSVTNSQGMGSVNNNDVLVMGDNGNYMFIPQVIHPAYPNGNSYIVLPHKSSTEGVDEFNTKFPVGTNISYYTTVRDATIHNDTMTMCDIYGEPSNYKAEWLVNGINGVPYSPVDGATTTPLSAFRAGPTVTDINNNTTVGVGGYVLPLSRRYNGTTPTDTAYLVTLTANGVTTTIPHLADYAALITAGTSVGCYLNEVDNKLYINLNGIGSYDTAIESTGIIQVFYKTDTLYGEPIASSEVLTIDGGVMLGYYSKSQGSRLTDRVMSKPTINRDNKPGSFIEHFDVDTKTMDSANKITTTELWGIKPEHGPLHTSGLSNRVKVLPYLTKDSQDMGKINLYYKELVSKGLETITSYPGDNKFGRSITTDQSRLIISSTLSTHSGTTGAGKVYVYEQVGNKRTLIDTILPPDPVVNGYFGVNVSANNNGVLVIGCLYATGDFIGAGRAYVYVWDGVKYVLKHTVTNPQPTTTAGYFGFSVYIVGDTVYVGAPSNLVGAVVTGQVVVYTWNGTTLTLLTTINNPVLGLNDYFGHTITANNNTLVVSVPNRYITPLPNAGGITTFGIVGSVYTYVHFKQSPLPLTSGYYGRGLELIAGGTMLLVTETDAASRSIVRVYARSGVGWAYSETLNMSGNINGYLGYAMHVANKELFIGSLGNNKVEVIPINTDLPSIFPDNDLGDTQTFETIGLGNSVKDDNGTPVSVGQLQIKTNRFLL